MGGRHDLRVGEKMAEKVTGKKVSRAITRPAATEVRMPTSGPFRPDRVARPMSGPKETWTAYRRRDQHNEDAHLFRHPTPEDATPKELTMAWMSRKEVPHQQLLKGHRRAQPQLSADNVPVEAQVSPGESEGQRPGAGGSGTGRQAR